MRKREGGKIHYKKLKKQLRKEKSVKSLAQSLQRDMEDTKETDTEFKRQFQKDVEKIRLFLEQTTESQVDKDNEKKAICERRAIV